MFLIRPDLTAMTDEVLAALAARPDLGLYVRSRMLATVATASVTDHRWLERAPEAPIIMPMTEPRLLAAIDRAARYGRWDVRANMAKRAMPPSWLPKQIMGRTAWPLPPLHGLIGAPTLRPDGSVLDEPGYDPDTGLYLAPMADAGPWPGVPSDPTPGHVRDAVEQLLAPVRDFPFVTESDRAAYLAAVSSLLFRRLINGPVPLFGTRAPTPGTGKTLLVSVIGIIGTGRVPDMMTMSDAEELRKRVTSLAMDGTPAVVLDNVSGALGSDLLASILTRTTWEDRLLGMSQQVTLPLSLVWFATGNNLSFKRTLGRRAVPIDLDAHVENPEDRTGFAHANLLGHVTAHRLEYVAAALTIMRAFYRAGRPRHGKARMGSFEAWDDLARGAVMWAGLDDPAPADSPDRGRGRIRSDADDDVDALAMLLEQLGRLFPARMEFTVADVIRRSEQDHELALALAAVAGDGGRGVTPKGLAYCFRNVARRPAGGLQLNDAGHAKRPRRYYVVAVGASDGDDGTIGTIGSLFARGFSKEEETIAAKKSPDGRIDRPDRPIVTDDETEQTIDPTLFAELDAKRRARTQQQRGDQR